jgi:hypothetical protein
MEPFENDETEFETDGLSDEDIDVSEELGDYDDSMDGDHESALESVYGPEDSYLDSSWEDQSECDGGFEYDGE